MKNVDQENEVTTKTAIQLYLESIRINSAATEDEIAKLYTLAWNEVNFKS